MKLGGSTSERSEMKKRGEKSNQILEIQKGTTHPPKMITNNAAPVLSADLAYEAHGKCGCQTIFLTEEEGG